MIVREVTGMNGKRIVEMIPENAEDEQVLMQMARSDAVDSRDGFSTEPDLWENDDQDDVSG